LAAFVPGLKSFEPIHIDGSAETNRGIAATMTTPFISYNGNDITGLNVDESMKRFEVVYAAAGTSNSAVPIDVAGLLAITGGQMCDVCYTN
jgi:hypothetical protein